MNHAKRYVFKHLPFIVLLLLATLAVFNTTINDHYEWGPTLFDSAGYSTMMWHGNLRLDLAPVFSFSFYTDHAATINYIPVVLSYLWPLDHISYYAAFYAAIHAGLLVACYITVRPLFPGRFSGVWATFCTAALFFGSTVYLGAWEMRSDHIAPPCMIMAFRAWQLSRYRQALLWFALTCSVREDIGAYLLLPIGLLTGLQYLQLRKEEPALARKRRNYGLALCGFCLCWALVSNYVQKTYFPVYDLLQDQYYDRAHPFAHLSPQILLDRVEYILTDKRGIILPMAILAFTAIFLRDWELLIGAIAFSPYMLAMFLSKSELAYTWGSYKSFLLIPCNIWPAIMAMNRSKKRRDICALLQISMLMGGLASISETIPNASLRWFIQPHAANSQLYLDFGKNQLDSEKPADETTLRVSHSLLALYPYQFKRREQSWIHDTGIQDYTKIQTYMWFDNDRDEQQTQELLKSGNFTIREIEGTKLRIATRNPVAPGKPAKPGY